MLIRSGLVWMLAVFWPGALAAESEVGPAPNADGTALAEELLTRDPTTDDYGGQTRCVDMKKIRTTRVLDESHVVLEMRQDQYYVIQLHRRCPGLRRNRPVMTEPRGRQLCQFDSIRPMHANGYGGLEPGPRCSIPGFHSVTKEQVVQLRESLAIERKRARQERRERRKSRNS